MAEAPDLWITPILEITRVSRGEGSLENTF